MHGQAQSHAKTEISRARLLAGKERETRRETRETRSVIDRTRLEPVVNDRSLIDVLLSTHINSNFYLFLPIFCPLPQVLSTHNGTGYMTIGAMGRMHSGSSASVVLQRRGRRFRLLSVIHVLVRCMFVLVLAFLLASITALLRLESNPSYAYDANTADPPPDTHDPYLLFQNPPEFTVTNTTCSVQPGTGEEGPAGVRALYKIYTYREELLQSTTSEESQQGAPERKIRLLCMVYTHSNRHDVVRAIAETYGQECDGFLAASNFTDPSIGAYALPHDGPEEYGNMWNKVQKMWQYAYHHYLLKFDWFLICGDDTFVIPDNVRDVASYYEKEAKLKSAKVPPLYLGASIPHSKNPTRRFCGGGAGYMLNQQAVALLNRRMQMGECPDAVASDEDIRVARCLDDAGVKCHDTNDLAEEVRFHHLDAQFHASWTPVRSSLWLWPKLQYFHGIRGNQSKLEQISNTSTTFHLDKSKVRSRERDRGIRRYHALLHPEVCGSSFADQVRAAAICDSEKQAELRRQWMTVDSRRQEEK